MLCGVGLNRTDPDAVWSFQGFAFVGWSTDEKAAWLKGFIDAVPDNHFNVIDMGYSGSGEWHKAFFSLSPLPSLPPSLPRSLPPLHPSMRPPPYDTPL